MEGLVSQSHIQCGSEGVLPWRSKETVDQSPEESDREEPKRRRIGTLSPSDPTRNTLTFACPYRKHDRRKYCVQNWGPCALTPQKTVARVKGHLYKYHQVHECQRCKGLFKSSAELDTHIEAIAGCEARPFMGPCEGITSKVKKRLQCRKKAFPGQSEADRWKDIYQILFPNEELPSPYFDPIQDHRETIAQSPSSQGIAHFEQYIRRQLPRFFRNALERADEGDIRHIELQSIGRIMDRLEEAQDRTFSSYRGMFSSNFSTPPETAPPDTDTVDAPSTSSRNNVLDVLEFSNQHPRSGSLPESFTILKPKFGSTLEPSLYTSDSSRRSSSGHTALEGAETNTTGASGSQSHPAEDGILKMSQEEDSAGTFTNTCELLVPLQRSDTNALSGFPVDMWGNLDNFSLYWGQFDAKEEGDAFKQ